MNKTIEEYTKEIHQQNVSVGWWDNPDECIYQKIQLISTEICEATEGERKNLMDDHLPTRKMGEVELADALIRTLDLGGKLRLVYDSKYRKPPNVMVNIFSSIGKQHLGITQALAQFSIYYDLTQTAPDGGWEHPRNTHYSELIESILKCAEINSYDIYAAMDEKLIYNKNRQDHKRENRKQEGGKSF